MTQNETNTPAVRSSAYEYAENIGNSSRICKRYESCFAGCSFEYINERYPNVANKLLFLSQDIGLDRTGMTRSQIVMAYNKQNNAWKGIVAYIQMQPDRAFEIINSFSYEGLTCAGARLALVAVFAQSNR